MARGGDWIVEPSPSVFQQIADADAAAQPTPAQSPPAVNITDAGGAEAPPADQTPVTSSIPPIQGPEAGGSPVAPGGAPPGLTLTELMDADPSRGWGTKFYPVYTNQGDIGSAIPGTLTNQRVRLVDPSTGATLVEGTGNEGAQQIATLANAVGQQLGKKAAYNIEVEFEPGKFTHVGGEDVDHPHANFLKTLVQIAAPLLGAAIPGIGPVLGAALGGGIGNVATGGNLKSALLAAAMAGAGNSLGNVFSRGLQGLPISASSFLGSNSLGGLLSSLGGSSGALTSALQSTAGVGGAGVAGTVSPLIVTAGLGSGIGGALPGIIGTGLGALTGASLGAGAAGGATGTATGGVPATEPTVDPLTVTANPLNSSFAIPGIPGILPANAGGNGLTTTDTAPQDAGGEDPSKPKDFLTNLTSKDNLLDMTGQVAGGVAGDLGVLGLAHVLGFVPGGGGGAAPATNLTAGGFDDSTDPSSPGGGVAGTPGGGGTGPTGGTTTTAGTGTGTGTPAGTTVKATSTGSGQPGLGDSGGRSALGNVLGVGNAPASPVAPLGASAVNVRGSTAPDIYPWRGHNLLRA